MVLEFAVIYVFMFLCREVVGKEEKEEKNVDHGDAWKCTWKLSSGNPAGTHNLCIPTPPTQGKRLQHTLGTVRI